MSADSVWINGSFSARADAQDRGLTLGDGVFDTLVALGGVPFAGDAHLERLHSQAGAIGITTDIAQVRAGWSAVLDRAAAEHVILRTTITRGPSGRGLWPQVLADPTVIVSGTPWDARLLAAPVRLVTSTITRNPGSPSSGLKTLGYLDNILAARDAARRGADDALLLTPSGHVACTTIANVFAIAGDRLRTPPLTDAVQPGIMRRLVLEAADEAGLKGEERSLTLQELSTADQLFLTNSVRFLCPCRTLDGHGLSARGEQRLRALTRLILARVSETCGVEIRPK